MNRFNITLIALGLATAIPVMAATNPAQQPFNLNQATAQQLANLPGIGKAKATAIVMYRKQHGAFKSVNELTSVKGIGPKLLAREKPFLTIK